MLAAAHALMFDFHAAPANRPATPRLESWNLCSRQKSAPPFPHLLTHIWEVQAGDAVAANPQATLSAGPFLPRHSWSGEADDARTRYALIAFTNAKDGREDDFDRWYWDRHFPDGLRLPGCFAGRRYILAPQAVGPYRHLAIYLYDNEDVNETLDVLQRIGGTPEMPGSDAISPVHDAWYVQPGSVATG